MEPLDLPLGLGMVALAVLDGDPQDGELGPEATPAVAELGGKDGPVEFLGEVKPPLWS